MGQDVSIVFAPGEVTPDHLMEVAELVGFIHGSTRGINLDMNREAA